MPFVPLDTSRESGMKPAVFLTPEEQQWGEDKATHDVELQKEIDRAKSPAIKKVLLEEQQKRAQSAIDTSRPIIRNPDGSFSTERTITVETDGKHYLIPTIVGGKQLSQEEAIAAWRSGENKPVGIFDTASEAESAAVARSKRIGEVRGAEAKPKGFTPIEEVASKEGPGLFERLIEQSLPAMMGRYQAETDLVNAQLRKIAAKPADGKSEFEQERERRVAANEKSDPASMMKWAMDQAKLRVHGKPPPEPSDIGDILTEIKDAAVKDPIGFGKQLLEGAAAHPEYFVAGPLGPVVAAGESAMEQIGETGQVDWKRATLDGLMAAAPAAVIHATIRVGHARAAAQKGAKVTPEAETQAVAEVKAKVEEGVPPMEATGQVLDSMGVKLEERASLVNDATQVLEQTSKESLEAVPVSKATAEDVAKPEGEPHAIEEGKVEGGGEQQHPRTDAQRTEAEPSGSDSNEGGGQIPKEEEKVVRPQQFKPLEGVAKKPVPAETARSILESADMEPDAIAKVLGDKEAISIGALRQALSKHMGGQKFADPILREAVHGGKLEAGRIDPRLLGALGIAGLGGLVTGIYTQDPQKAMLGALATGGMIAGGALLGRTARGLGKVTDFIRDNRIRIGHLTDDFWKTVNSGELGNARFSWQIKALVGDKKMREQITHYLQGDRTIQLTPEAQQAANVIERWFAQQGEKGKLAGILPDDLLNNYVTQLWTGLNKNDGLVRNLIQSLGKSNSASPGMAPRSRFSMERTIPSYKEGMARGMIPTTLDIAEIVKIYGNNINKAIANKNLISALQRERTPWGESLMVRDTPEAIAKTIAQAAAMVDRQWQGGGALAKEIRDFAIRKAPKEFVTINHPQMRGFKVHQDIAAPLKALFDAKDANAATRAAYAVAVAAKRGLFSYSFFHVKSLTDAMLGTSMRGWVKVVNGDAWRQLRHGQAGDVVDLLVQNGLKVTEKPVEGDVTPFANAMKLIEEKYPIIGAPVKGAWMVGKAMNWFLWDVVHPTFKTAAAMAAFENTMRRNPNMSRVQAAKASASFTNDIFGSLDWYRIADSVQNKYGRDLALAVTSPSGRRFMQIMMLAPDWTVSTTRAMVKAIPGISSREIAALHQGYVVRSTLLYLTVANGLNYYFTGHSIFDNADPTMVDLGDGRKMQVSKHFMEPIHWLTKPGQQAMNKLGYLPKELLTQAIGQEYLSTKGAPPIKNRLTHIFAGAMPITGQQAWANGTVPAITGFLGAPIYGKTDAQALQAAKERAAAKQEEWAGKSDKEKIGHRAPLSPEKAAAREQKRRDRQREVERQRRAAP